MLRTTSWKHMRGKENLGKKKGNQTEKNVVHKIKAVFEDGSQLGIIFMTDHWMPSSLRIWF